MWPLDSEEWNLILLPCTFSHFLKNKALKATQILALISKMTGNITTTAAFTTPTTCGKLRNQSKNRLYQVIKLKLLICLNNNDNNLELKTKI